MTKYLTEERFVVTSTTKESLKNYADNYDRIFGKKDETPCPVCSATDHERVEAFGTTVQGCPEVPPDRAVMFNAEALVATCKRCGGPRRSWQVYCGAACSEQAEADE